MKVLDDIENNEDFDEEKEVNKFRERLPYEITEIVRLYYAAQYLQLEDFKPILAQKVTESPDFV